MVVTMPWIQLVASAIDWTQGVTSNENHGHHVQNSDNPSAI